VPKVADASVGGDAGVGGAGDQWWWRREPHPAGSRARAQCSEGTRRWLEGRWRVLAGRTPSASGSEGCVLSGRGTVLTTSLALVSSRARVRARGAHLLSSLALYLPRCHRLSFARCYREATPPSRRGKEWRVKRSMKSMASDRASSRCGEREGGRSARKGGSWEVGVGKRAVEET